MSDLPDEAWTATITYDGHRLYIEEVPHRPKKVCLRFNGEERWYEPDSSANALLALLAEAKKRAEQAEAGRDRLRAALEEIRDMPYSSRKPHTVFDASARAQEALDHD